MRSALCRALRSLHLPRLRRRTRLERLVEEALRSGVGLYRHTWLIKAQPVGPQALADLAETVKNWCAQEMGKTRRPYGIDHMALGIACAAPGRDPIASATVGVFRSADFYRDGGAGDQVAAFVRSLPLPAINEEPDAVRVAVALFSWGDVARATVYRD